MKKLLLLSLFATLFIAKPTNLTNESLRIKMPEDHGAVLNIQTAEPIPVESEVVANPFINKPEVTEPTPEAVPEATPVEVVEVPVQETPSVINGPIITN